jgi:hypothetical protein
MTYDDGHIEGTGDLAFWLRIKSAGATSVKTHVQAGQSLSQCQAEMIAARAAGLDVEIVAEDGCDD